VILRPSSATGLPKPARSKQLTREEAEALALAALEFLSGEGERIGRFLALSGLDPGTLRKAAAEGRAEGMRISDRWVEDGCDPASPAIEEERAALIRGYTALRDAVRSDASS